MTTEEMTAPSDAGREPRGFDRGPREDRSSRDDRGGDRDDRGGGRRFGARRRGCAFCIDKIETPDYKDVSMLRRYVTERGKLEPRRKVGTCAKHQRFVALAVKRARQVALLPYTAEQDRTSGVLGGGRSSSSGRR